MAIPATVNESTRKLGRRAHRAGRSLFSTHVRRYWPALLVGSLFTVLQVLTKLAHPLPLGWLIDRALVGAPKGASAIRGDLLLAVGSLAAVVTFGALLDYWSTRLLSSAALHVATDMRSRAFIHLHRLSLGYHKRHQVNDLSSRVTTDVDHTRDMLVQLLCDLAPTLLRLVGTVVIMAIIAPTLTLLSLSTTPLIGMAVHHSRRKSREATRRAHKADLAVASLATGSLGAIELVQAFVLEPHQSGHFDELSGNSLSAGVETIRLQARFGPTVDAAGLVSILIVLWVGANRVADGQMKLGVLLIFLTYVGSLYKPVKALMKLTTTFATGSAAADRIDDVLSTEPDIDDRRDATCAPPFKGHVRFDEVTFSDGRAPLLWSVSFDVNAGETVALVGPDGPAKSTLASLVPRLMDPVTGRVLIDDRDIRDYTVASLRAQVSVVFKDTMLLPGTIRDNIACGRPGASRRAIERAAQLAFVDEFTDRVPDGLDTSVTGPGVDLSSDQRQRIAIARAILRDAPILILDEPTSAFETESEELIVAAIDNLPRSRTTLIIAHRLSTVRRADRIVVLDGGVVVEAGMHDVLTSADGLHSHWHDRSRKNPDGFLARIKADEDETKAPTTAPTDLPPSAAVNDLTSAPR